MTTLRRARVLIPAACAALLVGMAPVTAHATGTGAWGAWSDSANSGVPALDGTSTLSFAGEGNVQAGWTMTGVGAESSIVTTDEDGEYFTADTAIGQIFGSNGPSAESTYLKVTADAVDDPATVTITFASPVQANSLGFALSDLDTDYVTVTAADADGVQLSDEALKGSAGASLNDLAFNFCTVTADPVSCDGDTAVPAVTSDGLGEITVSGVDAGTTGSSAWFQPSAAVTSIVFTVHNTDDGGASSVRIWMAQLPTTVETPAVAPTPAPTLAETGATTTVLPWGIAALVAGAAALVLVRRRSTLTQ